MNKVFSYLLMENPTKDNGMKMKDVVKEFMCGVMENLIKDNGSEIK